jgi:hypothetical protein
MHLWLKKEVSMNWLYAALKGIFSGIAQGILSAFGMSDAQKLGRAEVTRDTQAKVLDEVRKSDDNEALSNRIGDDALRLQLSRFKRPD